MAVRVAVARRAVRCVVYSIAAPRYTEPVSAQRVERASSAAAMLVAMACGAPSVPAVSASPRDCPDMEEQWVHLPIVLGGGQGIEDAVLLEELHRTLEARSDVVLLRVESHDCSAMPPVAAQERSEQIVEDLRARGLRVPMETVAYARGYCTLCECLPRPTQKCSIRCPSSDEEVLRTERRVEFSIRVRRCPEPASSGDGAR
jgi:hypothetical protein